MRVERHQKTAASRALHGLSGHAVSRGDLAGVLVVAETDLRVGRERERHRSERIERRLIRETGHRKIVCSSRLIASERIAALDPDTAGGAEQAIRATANAHTQDVS